MKFLIAADNSDLIQFLICLINQQNDDYLLLDHTFEFNQSIRNFQPDWILVDLSLREINGFEMAETIRREIPLSKICLLADSYDKRFLKKAKHIGSDVLISKENLFDFYNILNNVITK